MKIVQYGKWKIGVDVEKTKEYYRNYVINETQPQRNFIEYCKSLSDEEKEFFESFGITPECCEISHIGVNKKKEAPGGGEYLICGSYLEYPSVEWIPAEEFVEDIFENEFEDPRIQIGLFQFDFQCEECGFYEVPDNMPEGFICVRFWCEELRWLLDEKPEEVMYEPAKPWEVLKLIGQSLRAKRMAHMYFEECRRAFVQKFDELGIWYSEMNTRDYKKYKKLWVDTYSPVGADKKKIVQLCVKNRKYSTFLWHIFSFEYLNASTEEAASLYDASDKKECTIISNVNLLGFRLTNADALTSGVLSEFQDVTVTASDFSWTYSKTHEEYCGPYYYKKGKTLDE